MKQNEPLPTLVDNYAQCGGVALNKTRNATSVCQIINKRNAPIP